MWGTVDGTSSRCCRGTNTRTQARLHHADLPGSVTRLLLREHVDAQSTLQLLRCSRQAARLVAQHTMHTLRLTSIFQGLQPQRSRSLSQRQRSVGGPASSPSSRRASAAHAITAIFRPAARRLLEEEWPQLPLALTIKSTFCAHVSRRHLRTTEGLAPYHLSELGLAGAAGALAPTLSGSSSTHSAGAGAARDSHGGEGGEEEPPRGSGGRPPTSTPPTQQQQPRALLLRERVVALQLHGVRFGSLDELAALQLHSKWPRLQALSFLDCDFEEDDPPPPPAEAPQQQQQDVAQGAPSPSGAAPTSLSPPPPPPSLSAGLPPTPPPPRPPAIATLQALRLNSVDLPPWAARHVLALASGPLLQELEWHDGARAPAALAQLAHLRRVEIPHMYHVGDAVLRALLRLPRLESLLLFNPSFDEDHSRAAVASPSWRELQLTYCTLGGFARMPLEGLEALTVVHRMYVYRSLAENLAGLAALRRWAEQAPLLSPPTPPHLLAQHYGSRTVGPPSRRGSRGLLTTRPSTPLSPASPQPSLLPRWSAPAPVAAGASAAGAAGGGAAGRGRVLRVQPGAQIVGSRGYMAGEQVLYICTCLDDTEDIRPVSRGVDAFAFRTNRQGTAAGETTPGHRSRQAARTRELARPPALCVRARAHPTCAGLRAGVAAAHVHSAVARPAGHHGALRLPRADQPH